MVNGSVSSNGMSSLQSVGQFIKENPILSSAIAVGTIGAVTGATLLTRRKTRVSRRRKAKTRVSRRRRVKRSRRIKHRTSAKGRLKYHKIGHRKTKGIHYTKSGQPYIILRSGKARFIKRSSAKRSKKMKGGRY